MSNLFSKAVIFTDIHLGLKSNSMLHLNDCWEYIQWMTSTAKKANCETCIFLGDFHNNRATISIVTLNHSIKCLEYLSRNFEKVYFIPGNHDIFHKDKRHIQSVEWAKHIPNIEIVNDFVTRDNVSFVPWLVGDDYKRLSRIKADYMFGHFELPNFYMNAMVKMPDHGEVQHKQLRQIGHVFSGHFHKRQHLDNVTYIGNCFPHNYSDANDDERGCAILTWGDKPVYHTWKSQPTYRVYTLSNLLSNTDNLLQTGMHVRVNLDIEISYEESAFIKQTFISKYDLREMVLVPSKPFETARFETQNNVVFESVDQIVAEGIGGLDVETYDPRLLLDIYRNL